MVKYDLFRGSSLNVRAICLFVISSVVSSSGNASPTSNEFISCKKMAVSVLELCLNDDDLKCWSKSKSAYKSCHKKVIENHQLDYERIKAENVRQKQFKKQ